MQILSNLNYSLKTCTDKASHNKISDILHKFLNKMTGQTCSKKSQTIYNLKRREYKFHK